MAGLLFYNPHGFITGLDLAQLKNQLTIIIYTQ
ncbi:hypothetical protein C8J95_104350 [Elizabethkingia sp. YR214]|nr:hypothetical protein C8J95_104350 [Elizabethkingia sp. YR214]